MSSDKEPHFFIDCGSNVPSVKSLNLEEYNSLFIDASDEKYVGESSVSYLHNPGAAGKIQSYNPDSKIIILLRNPLNRMYSHWLMDSREGVNKHDFRFAVEKDYASLDKGFGKSHMYVECGLYAQSVKQYIETFGRESVYIGFFETFVKDPDAFMNDLLRWFKVNEDWDHTSRKSNPAAVPKNKFYKFLFHNFTLRKILKKTLNKRLRSMVRTIILKDDVEKNKIGAEDVDYFKKFFIQDINLLLEVLPDREKEIKSWGL